MYPLDTEYQNLEMGTDNYYCTKYFCKILEEKEIKWLKMR